MFEEFFKSKVGPLVLRLAVGLACLYHGFVKIQAGGGTAWQPGMATFWQMTIAWSEFAAGLALLLGFYCRIAALTVAIITAATLLWWQGWHVVRLPLQTLEPYLFFFLVSLAVLFFGAGELSIDNRSSGGSSGGHGARKRVAA